MVGHPDAFKNLKKFYRTISRNPAIKVVNEYRSSRRKVTNMVPKSQIGAKIIPRAEYFDDILLTQWLDFNREELPYGAADALIQRIDKIYPNVYISEPIAESLFDEIDLWQECQDIENWSRNSQSEYNLKNIMLNDGTRDTELYIPPIKKTLMSNIIFSPQVIQLTDIRAKGMLEIERMVTEEMIRIENTELWREITQAFDQINEAQLDELWKKYVESEMSHEEYSAEFDRLRNNPDRNRAITE